MSVWEILFGIGMGALVVVLVLICIVAGALLILDFLGSRKGQER